MRVLLSPYDPGRHGDKVYAIWQQVLGETWPLSRATFDQVTIRNSWYQAGDHLVALSGAEVVGFAATLTAPNKSIGEIMLVMVERAHQAQHIGTMLLQAATDKLFNQGCREIQLGGGGRAYFWPGVPNNLPQALNFFKKNGWEYTESAVDMVCNLETYTTPDYVYQRIADVGVSLHIADATTAPAVLAFEHTHFPRWAESFQHEAKTGNHENLVYAADRSGAVVGSVIVSAGRPNSGADTRVWKALLGETMGIFGAMGVAEDARGQGIGLALTALANEVLQKRGAENCFLGWMGLADWYGKLGYTVWRTYRIGWKTP